MEELLKQGFELIISQNFNGDINATFIKRNSEISIESIVEASPALIDYLSCLDILKEQLGYAKHITFCYNLENFCYQVALKKRKSEGPYNETVSYEILQKAEHDVLTYAISKMEEKLQIEEDNKLKSKLQLYEPLFQKVKDGYQLSLKVDQNREFIGALALKEKEVYKDFIELEEKEFAFIYDLKPLKKQLVAGKVLGLSYDSDSKNYKANLKERKLYDTWQEKVNWEKIYQEEASTGLDVIVKLNKYVNKQERKRKVYVKNKTLLVMAAGMGSRFGGLKQIEPVGPNQEFLIDYSVYDAIKAGFTKIVFIIKEENYSIFKETIGKRVEPHISVEYVFQKNDNVPHQEYIPQNRVKPLGTGHAILCAKNVIDEPFAIINADDFYGRDAYVVAANYLETIEPYHYAVVGYSVANTLSPNGSAKRGICRAKGNKLEAIIESSVERIDGEILAKPLNGSQPFTISDNTTVSMNLLLFTPDIFGYLEEKLEEFIEVNKDDLETKEFLIPDVLQDAIQEGAASVELLDTKAVWTGVTYKEDKEVVVKTIADLIQREIYPNELWTNK